MYIAAAARRSTRNRGEDTVRYAMKTMKTKEIPAPDLRNDHLISSRWYQVRLAKDEKVKSNGHDLPQPEPYFQSASIRLTKQSKTPMVARDHEISLINKRNVIHQVTRFEVVVVVHPVPTRGKRRYGH